MCLLGPEGRWWKGQRVTNDCTWQKLTENLLCEGVGILGGAPGCGLGGGVL